MVLVTINHDQAYYIIASCSNQYFNDIIYDNLDNFIHIAAFWKILDEMSMYDNYSNLLQYKLEMMNFIDEAINCLVESIDICINDTNKMMMQLMNIIKLDQHSQSEHSRCEIQSEIQCEPSFQYCLMGGIIYELLNQITFGIECDPTDPTDPNDFIDSHNLYETLQLLKKINSEILIE